MGEKKDLDMVMDLIVHSGNAKSLGMEAIQVAKKGNFEQAKEKFEEANNELVKAHHTQTALLQQESLGNRPQVSLLMVHGQDHLMNAITFLDLAKELAEVYETRNRL
ncbi:PTS lactose/cellobiose transporter subunit IIA [Heyndrickxia acidiproducens]|uniref:PTS lactose/cellobiose transporter subunit IIA n=1 Tax=Heyndrickxia acidiproducens TaxID=1121084 RepID=UPI000364E258|nr:PTS lactose/cellobiose transporter subunit IIA [Heyndrickxia acidiproducens]